MDEVKVRFEATDETVRVINEGPTKKLNPIFSSFLGIRKGDFFHDDWDNSLLAGLQRLRPLVDFAATVLAKQWSVGGSTCSSGRFNDSKTAVTSFVYGKSRYPGPTGGLRLLKPIFRHEIDREVRQDIDMLEHLARPPRDRRRHEAEPLRQSARPDAGADQPASTAASRPFLPGGFRWLRKGK